MKIPALSLLKIGPRIRGIFEFFKEPAGMAPCNRTDFLLQILVCIFVHFIGKFPSRFLNSREY